VSKALALREPERFVLVPEAATQVHQSLRTRWDQVDAAARRDIQRRIYRLQLEQEASLEAAHAQPAERILLLDRGTVDGAAYWPDGTEEYWKSIGTTLPVELARYDQVIWLETCAAIGMYDGDTSNAYRFEAPADAIASGEMQWQLWRAHPRLSRVAAQPTLAEKIEAVRAACDDRTAG
jgi:hypothetical protein